MTGEHPWPALELRHLVALRAVAGHGSFRAAAVALGFTQGALSQQIATLERRIGTRLVERRAGARRVVLTARGELLLQHSLRILDGVAEARTALGGRPSRPEILRVGAVASLRRLLGDAVAATLSRAAAVVVEVTDPAASAPLVEEILRGGLDLALVEDERARERTRSEVLHVDPFVAVVPSGCATATGRPLPLERLAGTRVYALPRSCESVARLEDVAAELGFPLAIAVRAADPDLLLQLVERAGGCALLPRLAVGTAPGRTTLALDRRLPPRMVSVVQRDGRGRSPAGEALVAALHRAVESRVPAAPEVEAGAGGAARAI